MFSNLRLIKNNLGGSIPVFICDQKKAEQFANTMKAGVNRSLLCIKKPILEISNDLPGQLSILIMI